MFVDVSNYLTLSEHHRRIQIIQFSLIPFPFINNPPSPFPQFNSKIVSYKISLQMSPRYYYLPEKRIQTVFTTFTQQFSNHQHLRLQQQEYVFRGIEVGRICSTQGSEK